jgi:hypothetical protein
VASLQLSKKQNHEHTREYAQPDHERLVPPSLVQARPGVIYKSKRPNVFADKCVTGCRNAKDAHGRDTPVIVLCALKRA